MRKIFIATTAGAFLVGGLAGYITGIKGVGRQLTAKEQDYMTYLELMNRSDKDVEECLKNKMPSRVKGWQKIMEESAIEYRFIDGRDNYELNKMIKSMKDSSDRNYDFIKEQGCNL